MTNEELGEVFYKKNVVYATELEGDFSGGLIIQFEDGQSLLVRAHSTEEGKLNYTDITPK